MEEIIELGRISSRGQVAIPSEIREDMGLKEGTRILFVLANDTLLIKKVLPKTFEEITKPLKEAAKISGLKEEEMPEIIHKIRANKR